MRIAIIENGIVSNVIEAEQDVANALFDNPVADSEITGESWIGARFNGEKFEPIKVFESWTWNESKFDYEPPAPKPDGDYYWNEAELDWLVIPEPEPEPEPAPE